MAEQVVKIEGTVPVTGSLTTTPSGTQNVAITGQPIGVSGTVAAYSVVNPAVTGTYVYSIADVTGVVATNNYLSLFNPVGSGKTLSFGGAFISSHVTADSGTPSSMRGYRITAASAGTLVTNSTAVAKFASTMATPVAELRTGNPTVTLGPAIFNSPPIESAAKTSSATVHDITVPPGAGAFTLAPGEGIVIQTAAGSTAQRWNISIVWGEI